MSNSPVVRAVQQFLCKVTLALCSQLRGLPDTGVSARVPDTFIQKTKKLYLDTRTQRNIAKLSEDLNEVHSIMTRNIAEVLGQGERLDSAHPALPRAMLLARFEQSVWREGPELTTRCYWRAVCLP